MKFSLDTKPGGGACSIYNEVKLGLGKLNFLCLNLKTFIYKHNVCLRGCYQASIQTQGSVQAGWVLYHRALASLSPYLFLLESQYVANQCCCLSPPHFGNHSYVPPWWAFLGTNEIRPGVTKQWQLFSVRFLGNLSPERTALDSDFCLLGSEVGRGLKSQWKSTSLKSSVHVLNYNLYPFMIIQFIHFVCFFFELSLLFVFVYWRTFICGY